LENPREGPSQSLKLTAAAVDDALNQDFHSIDLIENHAARAMRVDGGMGPLLLKDSFGIELVAVATVTVMDNAPHVTRLVSGVGAVGLGVEELASAILGLASGCGFGEVEVADELVKHYHSLLWSNSVLLSVKL
jgi:hypothetical protein